MSISNEAAIDANKTAIKALEKSIARLEELRLGKPLSERAHFTSEISHARDEITRIEIINEHLRAAMVVVAPMSTEVEARLRVLEGRLDQAIQQDALLNATLETVLDVVDAAVAIRAIIKPA